LRVNARRWFSSKPKNSANGGRDIEPGSPWQNGKGESFNGKFRDECVRMEIFGNWREAKVVAEQ